MFISYCQTNITSSPLISLYCQGTWNGSNWNRSCLYTQRQYCNKKVKKVVICSTNCNASQSCIDDHPVVCVYRFCRNTRLLVTRSVKERSLWQTSRYLGLWYVTSIMLMGLGDNMFYDWMICWNKLYHVTVINLVLLWLISRVVKHMGLK